MCYKKAIILNDEDKKIWVNLMYAYYGVNEFEKAEMCRQKVERWWLKAKT